MVNSKRSARGLLNGVLLASVASLAFQGAAASAQDAQTTSAQNPSNAEATSDASATIVVTGSRIARDTFTTPVPVTTMTEEQLVQAAPSTLADALRTLPTLVNSSGTQRNSGTRNGGQTFLNLRSLGNERTLTLLDGRRVVPSAITGSVDVNLIPSALIQRVEIVTGGASAAYGSDAVAGVVNFILDDKYEGVKLNGHYGITSRGDREEVKLTGAVGTGFADGRGRFIVSGEFYDAGNVRPEDRNWSSMGNNLINGPAGGPARILATDVRTVGTYGGMILRGNGGTAAANAAFAGIQFLPDGSPVPYSFGSYSSGAFQIGGDGVDTELIQELARPLNRKNIFSHVEYDVTDAVTLYMEGQYGVSKSDYVNALNRFQSGNPLTIQSDNAFLPQSIRDQMVNTGVKTLTLLRHGRERGFVHTLTDASTYQGAIGAKGNISGWTWEVYYQHGRNKVSNDIQNMVNVTRMKEAVDAVLSGGTIVCRAKLQDPTSSCVPFNPFGENRATEAALDYVLGTASSVARLDMDNFAASVSGELFQGWAGPIMMALGGEYRKEKAKVVSDPLSVARQYLFGNPQPWSGQYSVKEGFVEVEAPLLVDAPGAKELSVNAAYRLTDYSTSGSISSWKAGLSYIPIDGLRFRATRSRDIRAPSVIELFDAGRQATGSPTDPFNNNVIAQGIPVITGGNPNLVPERANTFTAGVVVQPLQVPGLSFSVDYYNISVKDAIDTIGTQQVLDQCFAGNKFACDQTVRDGSGKLIKVFATPINLSSQKISGLDFEASFRTPVGNLIGENSDLSFRNIVSYLHELKNEVPGSPTVDRSGEVGLSSLPHWQANSQLRVDSDAASVFFQGRLIGGGAYDTTKTAADLDLLHIKPQFYLDAQFAYKLPFLDRNIEAFVDIRNVLDHTPPIAPGAGNIAIATNPTLYELIGRNFRFGFRAEF